LAIKEKKMKTIIQKVKFKAAPKELYDIFLDSKKHSLATGSKANVNSKIGGKFTAWDGYISGRNLGLVPGQMIVQSWRTSEFKKADQDSVLILTFEKAPGGTSMTMIHTSVPDARAPHFEKGWHEHYWRPIQKYLKER
jgi:activator of HSP90 ATPase